MTGGQREEDGREVLITGMSKHLKEGKEGAATAMSWGKSLPGRDSSQCKGPEAEDEEVEAEDRDRAGPSGPNRCQDVTVSEMGAHGGLQI